jgi:hypothetical protein
MAIAINRLADLQSYATGVLGRADHHARNVADVLPTLLGLLVTYADPGTLRAREQHGQARNVLWAEFGGRRHVFTYDHTHGEVVVRQDSLQGDEVARVDNTTPTNVMRAILSRLH